MAVEAGIILRIGLFTMKRLESVPLREKNWSQAEHFESGALRH